MNKQWQPFQVGDRVLMTEMTKAIFLSFREPGYPVYRSDVEKIYIVEKTKFTSFKDGDLSEGIPQVQVSASSGITARAVGERWLDSSSFESAR